YGHLLEDPDRLVYGVRREIRGLKVGVAGFNSAWSCGRDNERGKLWLGHPWQVGELKRRLGEVDISIALIHHPGGWFVEFEEPDFSQLLQRSFHFHLHGHEHQGWVASDGSHTR